MLAIIDKIGSKYTTMWFIKYKGYFLRINGQLAFTTKANAYKVLEQALSKYTTTFYKTRTDATLEQLLDRSLIVDDKVASNYKVKMPEKTYEFLSKQQALNLIADRFFTVTELDLGEYSME